MNKIILKIVLFAIFLVSQILFCQDRLESHHHQFLLKEAWELVKFQHPEVINSTMDQNVGDWQNPDILDQDFVYGKLVTGAYREDWHDPEKMDKLIRCIIV
jgi:hypothetical protein